VLVREQIEERLRGALAPVHLEVRDVSHRHANHSGSRPEGQTHFELTITSAKFHGLGRLARHRLINEALADLLATRIHALAILEALPEDASREC
jgi:BolA family transcriptional regulator, general stress-responsive regulator